MARGAHLPDKGTARPRVITWKAGRVLYRVHSVRRTASRFNSTARDHHFGGGRFDSTRNDEFSYLYAAPRVTTALVECLVRGLRFDGRGNPRFLPRAELTDRLLSQVLLARDVDLVSLRSIRDLSRVQQSNDWLVHSEATEYAFTRRWGHWLRGEAQGTDGFVWHSRLDSPRESLVLFGPYEGDDTPAPPVAAGELRAGATVGHGMVEATGEPALELDRGEGLRMVRRLLAKYGIEVDDTVHDEGIGS